MKSKMINCLFIALLIVGILLSHLIYQERTSISTTSKSCHVMDKNIIANRYFIQTWIEVSESEYNALEVGDEYRLVREDK